MAITMKNLLLSAIYKIKQIGTIALTLGEEFMQHAQSFAISFSYRKKP